MFDQQKHPKEFQFSGFQNPRKMPIKDYLFSFPSQSNADSETGLKGIRPISEKKHQVIAHFCGYATTISGL